MIELKYKCMVCEQKVACDYCEAMLQEYMARGEEYEKRKEAEEKFKDQEQVGFEF